jgi:predicted nucleotidyltransferase
MNKAMSRGRTPVSFNWRRSLTLVLKTLRESGLLRDSIVVLTGSYAHARETPVSDIDILVLRREPTRRVRSPYGVHLRFEVLDDFRSRMAAGDDFAIYPVRFGALLHDGLGLWAALREEMKNSKWPDWSSKFPQVKRRIKIAEELLAMGDLEAAAEEYLSAATRVARASLLRRHVYPMSRPQLSEQLLTVGEKDLAKDLQRLVERNIEMQFLRRLGRELKKAMEEKR